MMMTSYVFRNFVKKNFTVTSFSLSKQIATEAPPIATAPGSGVPYSDADARGKKNSDGERSSETPLEEEESVLGPIYR
jgi:hypothetical protein